MVIFRIVRFAEFALYTNRLACCWEQNQIEMWRGASKAVRKSLLEMELKKVTIDVQGGGQVPEGYATPCIKNIADESRR